MNAVAKGCIAAVVVPITAIDVDELAHLPTDHGLVDIAHRVLVTHCL